LHGLIAARPRLESVHRLRFGGQGEGAVGGDLGEEGAPHLAILRIPVDAAVAVHLVGDIAGDANGPAPPFPAT
jgi:hypothetical protein